MQRREEGSGGRKGGSPRIDGLGAASVDRDDVLLADARLAHWALGVALHPLSTQTHQSTGQRDQLAHPPARTVYRHGQLQHTRVASHAGPQGPRGQRERRPLAHPTGPAAHQYKWPQSVTIGLDTVSRQMLQSNDGGGRRALRGLVEPSAAASSWSRSISIFLDDEVQLARCPKWQKCSTRY